MKKLTILWCFCVCLGYLLITLSFPWFNELTKFLIAIGFVLVIVGFIGVTVSDNLNKKTERKEEVIR